MGKLLVLSIFILAMVATGVGQDRRPASCPDVFMTDTVSHIELGEYAKYHANVGLAESQKQNLQYIWSASGGDIVGGQGTASIEILRSKEGLTVSVEVKGLPAGCPNTASVHTPYCPGPSPVKIAQIVAPDLNNKDVNFSEVVQTMNDNPNNQLYVYFSYHQASAKETDIRRERQLIEFVGSQIGGADRITSARQFEGVSLIQFWRVPPGAANPSCDKCDTSSCPTITVTGPAGITQPGEAMDFTAELSGDIPRNARYRWTVSEGQILGGQGTLRLSVQTFNKLDSNVTATLEILGLPDGCPNSASATNPVACTCGPLLIDEYARLPLREQMGRIDSMVRSLRERSDTKVLFIEYFVKRASQRAIDSRVRWLTDQMGRLKLSPAEFEIVTSESFDGHPRTKIYFIPPGASNPSP